MIVECVYVSFVHDFFGPLHEFFTWSPSPSGGFVELLLALMRGLLVSTASVFSCF